MLKPTIVDRYLLSECVKTWLGVILVLVVLTLGVGFARFIARAAAGELPVNAVLAVAGFSALENMEIVLPVSLMLAVMLTVGRLCRDNEMAALTAGGIGLVRLYRPFLLLALVLTALSAWMSLISAPQANIAMSRLSQQFGIVAQVQAFEAGRFHTFLDGKAAFYAVSINPENGAFENVFIRVRTDDDKEIVVLARTALQRSDEETGRQTLVLRDGWRYEGLPGRADYRVIQFAEHGVRVTPPEVKADYSLSRVSSSKLAESDKLEARAELQRRLSIPISVFLLAFIALPLGYVSPRSGRYGKLVLGVMLYLAYANGLRLAEVWFVRGRTPEVLGVWWVHVIVVLFIVWMIARREGYPQRLFGAGRRPASG